jgi:hypothetical protein
MKQEVVIWAESVVWVSELLVLWGEKVGSVVEWRNWGVGGLLEIEMG